MNAATKLRLIAHVARWLITRNHFNTHYRFTVPGNPKFMGPRDAIRLIPDGAVMAASGLGATLWASIIHRALRDLYKETGRPRDLTVVAIGGQGARGRSPGSLEELGLPGLCTRFFGGHFETFKSYLRLAEAGQLELQCIPQGVLAFLIDAQGQGVDSWLTSTGIGTFVDPRVGPGTPVAGTGTEQWVNVEDDKLRFRIPKITVAVLNAAAADRDGNIYMKHCAMIAENREIARAAKKNGGIVIVNVAEVVEKGYDKVFLRAEDIDAIVVYTGTEQTGSIKYRRYWPMFTLESDVSLEEGMARLRFLKEVIAMTPRRAEVDRALARLAATLFAENAPRGSLVNVGVGLPEEVCRMLIDGGLFDDITLFTESGVIGGHPVAGAFFGTAVCPKEMVSSVEIFRRCYERLDVSILGMLNVDSDGNVNVSKRGEGPMNYVGPGGFIDFSTVARTMIFVSSWMVKGLIKIENGQIKIAEPGKPKFIDHVDEITFAGKQAAQAGRKVFYVTNVGAFQLTPRGLQLIRVMPGIDIQRDIIDFCPMKILLPGSGQVPVVDESVVTGEGFHLVLRK